MTRRVPGLTRPEFLQESGLKSNGLDKLEEEFGFIRRIRPEERIRRDYCYDLEEAHFVGRFLELLQGQRDLRTAYHEARNGG